MPSPQLSKDGISTLWQDDPQRSSFRQAIWIPVEVIEVIHRYCYILCLVFRSEGHYLVMLRNLLIAGIDMFLFSFIIPILPDLLEKRLHQAHSRTQFLTSIVLAMNALVSILIAPLTAWVADHSPRKSEFMLFSWGLNGIGTVISAWVNTRKYGLE